MKNEPCPNCGGMLGVPDKLRGLPVECPVCRLEFVPGSKTNVRQKKSKSGKAAKSPEPSLRALPLPASITTRTQSGKREKIKFERSQSSRLTTPNPVRLDPFPLETNSSTQHASPVTPAPASDSDQGESMIQRRSADTPVHEIDDTSPSSAEPAQPAVARIIKSELLPPQLTKDGKLPSLQLVDEAKPKVKDGELKSNPVFVGLLVCLSLLTSGVMLFVAGMQPSESAKKVLEARQKIPEFYEVRIDQEVAPYQRELREAQLANSRGDFRAEIRNYEKVMSRFHAEDRNRFKGLTGSPTGDIELEEHVSILLNEAKRLLTKGN